MIISFLIVFGIVLYCMKPEERARAGRIAVAIVRNLKDEAVRRHHEPDPYREVLCARTPRAYVTLVLVVLNVAWFVYMGFGADDPHTLVKWGASFGPKTTNGEWWRLLTAMFVHTGLLHLIATVAGLLQIGLVLERIVGPLTFASMYFSAGLVAGVLSLSASRIAVSAGAAGAILGVYGALLPVAVASFIKRSVTTIPLKTAKRLAPASAFFIVYTAATGGGLTGTAAVAAIGVGLVYGFVAAYGIGERTPPAKHIAGVAAATMAVAVALAIPLRGITDVRPEIQRVVATETRIATVYDNAVGRLRRHQMTADALAQLIDRTIVPELHAAYLRVKELERVPPEQQPLVTGADEYFRLRDESWRLRAAGLRKTSMATLQAAERSERASLEALQRIQ